MVWIHGGGYEVGGTADPLYECSNLVRENPDIIAVSIAYRVGVFGFFHLSHLPDGKDYPDAQNLGLMDNMMALKWIHENIANFGGDPDNVTIFGESAGAESVTVLPLIKIFKLSHVSSIITITDDAWHHFLQSSVDKVKNHLNTAPYFESKSMSSQFHESELPLYFQRFIFC